MEFIFGRISSVVEEIVRTGVELFLLKGFLCWKKQERGAHGDIWSFLLDKSSNFNLFLNDEFSFSNNRFFLRLNFITSEGFFQFGDVSAIISLIPPQRAKYKCYKLMIYSYVTQIISLCDSWDILYEFCWWVLFSFKIN